MKRNINKIIATTILLSSILLQGITANAHNIDTFDIKYNTDAAAFLAGGRTELPSTFERTDGIKFDESTIAKLKAVRFDVKTDIPILQDRGYWYVSRATTRHQNQNYILTIGFTFSRLRIHDSRIEEPRYKVDRGSKSALRPTGADDPHKYKNDASKAATLKDAFKAANWYREESFVVHRNRIKYQFEDYAGGDTINAYFIPDKDINDYIKRTDKSLGRKNPQRDESSWTYEKEQAEEIDEPYYIGMDCIMAEINGGRQGGKIRNSFGGSKSGKSSSQIAYREDELSIVDTVYSWGNFWNSSYSGISDGTHFFNYFLLNGRDGDNEEKEPGTTTSKSTLTMTKWNDGEYDNNTGHGATGTQQSDDAYASPDIRTYNHEWV